MKALRAFRGARKSVDTSEHLRHRRRHRSRYSLDSSLQAEGFGYRRTSERFRTVPEPLAARRTRPKLQARQRRVQGARVRPVVRKGVVLIEGALVH